MMGDKERIEAAIIKLTLLIGACRVNSVKKRQIETGIEQTIKLLEGKTP